MKKIIYTGLICFLCTTVFAQKFDLPNAITLQTADDYKTYEKDILSAIAWAQNTPLTEQQVKRKEINAFLLQWMTGSPTVTIAISQDIVPFMNEPECLMAFMGGWTKYSLTNNYSKDNTACAIYAINHVIEFYKKNRKELGKISSIEKFIKKNDKGKLDSYITSKL